MLCGHKDILRIRKLCYFWKLLDTEEINHSVNPLSHGSSLQSDFQPRSKIFRKNSKLKAEKALWHIYNIYIVLGVIKICKRWFKVLNWPKKVFWNFFRRKNKQAFCSWEVKCKKTTHFSWGQFYYHELSYKTSLPWTAAADWIGKCSVSFQ